MKTFKYNIGDQIIFLFDDKPVTGRIDRQLQGKHDYKVIGHGTYHIFEKCVVGLQPKEDKE